MSVIRIADIVKESVVDGPGFRVVVFTQGCPRHCPGCHNPELIPPGDGEEVSPEQLAERIRSQLTPLTNGVTFSGGDPLMQSDSLHETIERFKKQFPHMGIWVYTGYLYEEVCDLPVMKWIDVLVDGPFREEQRDISLPFVGSANQRLVNVPASREAGKVVPWERPGHKSNKG